MSWHDLYPFSSHHITVAGGHRLHYLDEGPADGPPIVFVHGNPTWSFYWRDLIKAFRDTHRCVALDHIGMGLSDKPQDYSYTLARRIEDLHQLLEDLDIRDATLVVHDWGGAIGFGAALKDKDRFRRFVVFNTAAFLSDQIPFSIDICRFPIFGQVAVQGFNAFARVAQFRAIYDRSRLEGAVGEGYLAPYDSWANRIAIHRFVQDIPLEPSHPSYDTLARIDAGLQDFVGRPMLIVWGDDDFCFTPEFRREWERRFPEARVHALEKAGHYVVEDATDDIITWMVEHLDL